MQRGEACTLLALSLSESNSDSEVLQFSPPRRKLVTKRKRRRRPNGSATSPFPRLWYPSQGNCWPALDTVPRISRFLVITFVVGALTIESIMLVRLSNRVDWIIHDHKIFDAGRGNYDQDDAVKCMH